MKPGALAGCAGCVLFRSGMSNLQFASDEAERAVRGLGFVFFGGWYFADGAKEAAPA